MVSATPINETHVMRKLVIDGSTPFGFQRTAIVALDGEIQVGGKRVPIQTISLEEDACRKVKEEDETVSYRLDRLGIPLIEVVTGPVIKSPEEAERVALALGQTLRATGKVKRGLGTIRQDLNVSITNGAISEIKGVQELELISKIVAVEVQRQSSLLELRDEIRERSLKEEDLNSEIIDVTHIFKTSKCHVLTNATKNRCKVMAVVLPKLSGLLGIELTPGMHFGTELSDYAKFWGRVGGIFHSDELPAFGITEGEVARLKERLNMVDADAFVLVADREENAIDALKAVVERVKAAITGIPNETRSASPDATTHYSRPRPSAARMYPETDIPPVSITASRLKKIRELLPEPLESKLARMMEDYKLNEKLSSQLLNSDYCNLFEVVAQRTQIAAPFLAATLTETLKGIEREGVDLSLLSQNVIEEIFVLVDSKVVAKEAIPEILVWMVEHLDSTLEEAVEALSLKMVSEKELVAIVDKVVRDNEDLIRERNVNALSPLMGTIMIELRGKIDAKKVSQLILEKIKSTNRESQ